MVIQYAAPSHAPAAIAEIKGHCGVLLVQA